MDVHLIPRTPFMLFGVIIEAHGYDLGEQRSGLKKRVSANCTRIMTILTLFRLNILVRCPPPPPPPPCLLVSGWALVCSRLERFLMQSFHLPARVFRNIT